MDIYFFKTTRLVFVDYPPPLLSLPKQKSISSSFLRYSSVVPSSMLIPVSKESHGFPYDVFISFRGDIRHAFIGHLRGALERKRIKTFRDDNDDDLRLGEDISPAISKAIEESNILIVVLSENYASSKWCLDELVKILDCRKRNNKKFVFPIFYHVDPSEVRHQKNSYGKAITKHKNRLGKNSQKVQTWKLALSEISSLKGLHINTAKGDEINSIKRILRRVCDKLDSKPLPVGQDTVGLEHRKEEKRLKKEQEEEERKKKEKAEVHLYTIIKVARDEDLEKQIGKDVYFDLVDHDKVRRFRVQNQMPFNLFKEEVDKELGIPVQFQRFWLWAKRQNHSYRPRWPLTHAEEAYSVGQLSLPSNKVRDGELKLFLEVELGPNSRPIAPLGKTEDDILLFFKLYDPAKEKLRYVGRLFVKSTCKPSKILRRLNEMAGYDPDEEIELYEEIQFKPNVKCKPIDKKLTFRATKLRDGDIVCFQKAPATDNEEHTRFPDVPSYLLYLRNRQVVHFRSLDKSKEDGFCLEMSWLDTYDDVVERLAQQLRLDDPSKIRLTTHSCVSQQPKHQPIKYQGVDHLSDMLVHCNRTSNILYYEVLGIPLPELEGLKTLEVAFHHATKDEVVIHTIRFPKQSTVGELLDFLKTKVELSRTNAKLRLLAVSHHRIHKVLPPNERIEKISNSLTLRAEEIPEEEKNLGPRDRLIPVCHFIVDTIQNHVERLKQEQEEKAEARPCTIIKVARDQDLREQIGKNILLDLVDHDKVRSFCVQKKMSFNLFKEEVAEQFIIPVQFQRFWLWANRPDHSYRPDRPLAHDEEALSVGQLSLLSNKVHDGELKLFLEVHVDQDLRFIAPPEKTKDNILLFLKLYDPVDKLSYVGRIFVKSTSKPSKILKQLNKMAGYDPDEEIELFQEVGKCKPIDKKLTFHASELQDGDILCFRKAPATDKKQHVSLHKP